MRFHTDKLPEYNGLFDKNLRHHFESRTTQRLLHGAGLVRGSGGDAPLSSVHAHSCALAQIDGEGHVVDLGKNMSKLSIIEQEFRAAEKQEQIRLREEEEMRVRSFSLHLPRSSPLSFHSRAACGISYVNSGTWLTSVCQDVWMHGLLLFGLLSATPLAGTHSFACVPFVLCCGGLIVLRSRCGCGFAPLIWRCRGVGGLPASAVRVELCLAMWLSGRAETCAEEASRGP